MSIKHKCTLLSAKEGGQFRSDQTNLHRVMVKNVKMYIIHENVKMSINVIKIGSRSKKLCQPHVHPIHIVDAKFHSESPSQFFSQCFLSQCHEIPWTKTFIMTMVLWSPVESVERK